MPSTPGRDVLVALNRGSTAARLLSGAVHEVNNALMVISGTVEMLEAQAAGNPKLAAALQRLRNQGTRAAAALAEVLTFTKAPAEEWAPVNVREAAARSLSLRQFAIQRAGHTATFEADESRSFLAVGNMGQVQQVLLNLIANAEQALAGSRGSIAVQVLEEGPRVGVRVRDSGPGVSPVIREQLFEPFTSTREARDGTGAGLGLWAARTIAEAHGGTVVLEPTEGGASFVLWLPAA